MEYFCFRWNSNSTIPCLIAACSKVLKNVKHKKGKEEDIPAQNCSIFIVQFQFNLKQPYLLFNHFISLVIVPSSLRRLTYSSQSLFHSLFSANSFGPHFLLVPWLYFLFGCFWDFICPIVLPSSFSPLIIQRLNPPIPPTSL